MLLKNSERLVIRAAIGNVQIYEVDRNGNNLFSELIKKSKTTEVILEVIGCKVPVFETQIISINELEKKQIRCAVDQLCLLKHNNYRSDFTGHYKERTVKMIELELKDCILWAECSFSNEYINELARELPVLVCLDIFRSREPDMGKPNWDGCEFVISSTYENPACYPSPPNSYVPNTQEIADMFK